MLCSDMLLHLLPPIAMFLSDCFNELLVELSIQATLPLAWPEFEHDLLL